MDNSTRILIDNLLKEGVDMELIIRASKLSMADIEKSFPAEYNRYIGMIEERTRIIKKMMKHGIVLHRIIMMTGEQEWKVQKIYEQTIKKRGPRIKNKNQEQNQLDD